MKDMKIQTHKVNIENGYEYFELKWGVRITKPLTYEEYNKIDDLIWQELQNEI